MKTEFTTFAGALLVSALLAGSQAFLKSALSTAEGGGIFSLIGATLGTRRGWAALVLTGIAALLWLKILSGSDLGVVYPMVSLSYVIGLLLAVWFLGEKATAYQWAGVLLICAGVALVTHRV